MSPDSTGQRYVARQCRSVVWLNVAASGPICLGGYKRLEVSSVVCLLLPPQPSQQIITVIGLCRLKNANSAWAEKDDFPAKATLAEKDHFPAMATLA